MTQKTGKIEKAKRKWEERYFLEKLEKQKENKKSTLVLKGVRDEGRDENVRLNMDTTLTRENIDNGRRRKTRKKIKKTS